nr:MAG TPA: deoxynucleoside monophosphate kinase [Caudoviricetes sp.]
MIKIALAGTARAGKDTFGNILERELESQGYDVIKVAFADYLKEIYQQFFGHLVNNEKPRDAYVTLGNAFREIDINFWIRPVEATRDYLENTEGFGNPVAMIITDTRYFNEALWASQEGFLVVKVDADPLIRQARAEALGETLKLDNEGDSEVDLIQPDLTILNNGEADFQAMPTVARAAIEEYKARFGKVD